MNAVAQALAAREAYADVLRGFHRRLDAVLVLGREPRPLAREDVNASLMRRFVMVRSPSPNDWSYAEIRDYDPVADSISVVTAAGDAAFLLVPPLLDAPSLFLIV